MKVLSFGHIPSWAGGKQEQGLANVIYQLAFYMARNTSNAVYLAAFDVNIPQQKRGNLTLLGWSKNDIIKTVFFNPVKTIKWLLKVIECKQKFGYSTSNILGFFVKGVFLYKSLQKIRPDVLHLHGVQSLLYMSLIPADVKIALTIHGMTGNDSLIPNSNLYAELEKAACNNKRISKLYFITNQLVEDFTNSYGNIRVATEVILNAYDADKFNYIDYRHHNKIHIATIASVCDRKGQCRVVEGIAKSGIDCEYSCIGGGDNIDIENLQSLSKSLGVKMKYFGKKLPTEIRDFLAGVDYMILPSSSEGFGLVFLEAMACGVPVILPKDLPIVQEEGIIISGLNAILLDDCSSDSISKVLQDLTYYSINRQDVAKTVLPYRWDTIAKQYNYSFEHL